ncbi:MAG TPA: tetratricopeptide repeat protein [Verrucomicrobiae bacterium]
MPGLFNYLDPAVLISNPIFLLIVAFTIWMIVDAIRRQEYLWALIMFIFPGLSPILYFFLVYRAAPSATTGFELPGTYNRNRIKELQAQIHHLDKAHHHAELGDIYYRQGKLKDAEQCYRNAIERDGTDVDFPAHLGQCLLRQGRAEEAAPLLERIVKMNPKHDYGHTMMAYAEALTKLGQKDAALAAWKNVLENHTYARARVQLARLYLDRGEKELAKKELNEFLVEAGYGASFQRKLDKPWIGRAKGMLKEIR